MNLWSRSQSAAKFHGLVNQGATCYLNSVLQVLFMTEDFKDRVKRHKINNEGTEHIDSELTDLFTDLEKYNAYTYKVTKKLKITNVYEQRDAAEHYEKILRLTSPEASQIFRGELINRNTCHKCETQTESVAGFWHLPLPLVDSKDDYSVEKGIEDFFRSSVISEENQMYCENCDDKCDASLDCEVKHYPEVMALLLKRFEFNRNMRKVKINRAVNVPYTLHIPKKQLYELYACVEHSGELRYGHYISRIKSQDDGKWYIFDDSYVIESEYEHFQLDQSERSETAYLLFYRRQKAQDANTVPSEIGNSDTTQVPEVEIANGTEDTQRTTEEEKREENVDVTADATFAQSEMNESVSQETKRGTTLEESERGTEDDDDNSHINKRKQKKRGEQAVRDLRNSKYSQDHIDQGFQDNDHFSHSGLQNNYPDSFCIDIPEDDGFSFNSESQYPNTVSNTKWEEKPNTKKIQELCNVASTVNVNTGYPIQDIRDVTHGKHKTRERENEAVRRQQSGSFEKTAPQNQSEIGAHASAETRGRKQYETVKNDRDVRDNISGKKSCNTVSDGHQNDMFYYGPSGVPVNRYYSPPTFMPMHTDNKDLLRSKSVKIRCDEQLENREKPFYFGASVHHQGRTGSERTEQSQVRERQGLREPYHIHYPPQCHLSDVYRRAEERNNYRRTKENERSVAYYKEGNQTHMVIQSEKEVVERHGVENRPLTKHPHQERPEVSRDASRRNKESEWRERPDQWQEQNSSYSQRNTRHEPSGKSRRSRGSRSHDARNSTDALTEGMSNLTLSNQRDMKEEQKRREGKKRGYDMSRDSDTGLSENKQPVMHKQSSQTEDNTNVQIEEMELETNQAKKSKNDWDCCGLLRRSRTKHRK